MDIVMGIGIALAVVCLASLTLASRPWYFDVIWIIGVLLGGGMVAWAKLHAGAC